MEQIYTIENGAVVSNDLDEIRRNINMINGCPMPSGVRPYYEVTEEVEYRVMQAGENGCADNQYSVHDSEHRAQSDLDDVVQDEPERKAWIDEVTVFVVGYNKFSKFHEFARFESESDAEVKLNECIDELVQKDEQVCYYWSLEQAQEFLADNS
jgi:hypothetical protein